ncbi:MAG: acyltransferase [Singulisphaera sp.]
MKDSAEKPALAPRLPLVDAVRAGLASIIAWHHFLLYGPLGEQLAAGEKSSTAWLLNYRWVVPAFFVISGFVMSRGMMPATWPLRHVGIFVVRRYCRLGLPYLAAIGLAVLAAGIARPSLADDVLGHPPTLPQLAAPVLFLQDILGYQALSAGLWFVCIDFQLSLLLAGLLFVRDAVDGRRALRRETNRGTFVLFALGWLLALASLFYFNLVATNDVWATYYFGYFFLGMLLFDSMVRPDRPKQFAGYLAAIGAALWYAWRWRLMVAALSGAGLYLADRTGLIARWPRSRVVAYLGRTSYSLFLVHYPVLLVVEACWVRFHWTTTRGSLCGLATAYLASLLVADVFYRWVERPAARLSHRFA